MHDMKPKTKQCHKIGSRENCPMWSYLWHDIDFVYHKMPQKHKLIEIVFLTVRPDYGM